MISRPQPANRFQLLCSLEELPQAMAALSRVFGVQLESGVELEKLDKFPTLTPELAQRLSRYRELADRFQAYWPKDSTTAKAIPNSRALNLLDEAVLALESWRKEAEPIIEQLQEIEGVEVDLALLFEMLTHLGESTLDFANISTPASTGEERIFRSNLFVIPEILKEPPPTEPLTLLRVVNGEKNTFLVAVGLPDAIQPLNDWVVAAQGREFTIPKWCRGDIRDLLVETVLQMESNQQSQSNLWQQLKKIGEKFSVASLLQTTKQLEWFFSVMERAASNEQLARVEGWTDGKTANAINSYFEKTGINALVDIGKSLDKNPPILLVNPRWAKPFEIFPRLLGVPGRNEADPSPLLAVIAPLLFGFMFGDVGQGAVLALAGFALRKKFAAAWLMISGGVSATIFGFLFGSIFSREDIFAPLWLHPTQEPLTVLALPLFLGFLLIIGGMSLNGLGEIWSGNGKKWLLTDGGVTILYIGLAATFFHQEGLLVATAGMSWFLIGNYLTHKSFLKVLGRVGHLIELLMQLGVNTLSFARVGAFALAHAGLSMAVMTLSELPSSVVAGYVILILGNVLILALEGLVVSVQTTRLILFEFFVRFLRGSGRPFRPLPAPPT
jgi:V/A-type H+/Na+-transporting ATPase subunit I